MIRPHPSQAGDVRSVESNAEDIESEFRDLGENLERYRNPKALRAELLRRQAQDVEKPSAPLPPVPEHLFPRATETATRNGLKLVTAFDQAAA